MQQFDNEYIEQLFVLLEKFNNIITTFFENYSNKTKDIEHIDDYYKQKGEVINKIMEWAQTEEGADYIKNNSYIWNERVEQISIKEKMNLEYLDSKSKELGSKLRNLMKNKNLTVYLKGYKDDNRKHKY